MVNPTARDLTDDEITQCLLDAGVDAVEGERDGTNRMYWEGWHDQVIRAFRVAIAADRARWGRPAPAPAGEVGELVELVADLRGMARGFESLSYPRTAALITRAADLLEQRHGGVTATATNPLHPQTHDRIM